MKKSNHPSGLVWKLRKETHVPQTGTELLKPLPGITDDVIKHLFGKVPSGTHVSNDYSEALILTNNMEDPEAWNNGSGVYTLYTANGQWRIGGHQRNLFTDQLEVLIRHPYEVPDCSPAGERM